MPLPTLPKETLLPKQLEEYFLDEVGARSHGIKLEYEKHDYCHAMDLLRRRQEIACLDSILSKERKKRAEKQGEYRQRWRAAAHRMKQTDEAIVIMNDRYQEALEEKNRQLFIAARQDELRKGKEKEVGRLKKEAMLLKEVYNQTNERLVQFKPVEEYLERVRDMSRNEFKTTRDLLDRFNLLKDTRDTLMDRDNSRDALIRRRQNTLDGLLATKENETVLLNNLIFELTEELENLNTKQKLLEEEVVSIKTTASRRANNLSKIRMATYNLYSQACKMMERIPDVPPIDTVRQLHYIQGTMVEINKLRRQLQNILKKALERNALEQKLKEKKEKYEEAHHHHTIKTAATTRNFAAAFGLHRDAAAASVQHRDQSNFMSGKMKAVFAVPGETLVPETGGRQVHDALSKWGHEEVKGQTHAKMSVKPTIAALNQWPGGARAGTTVKHLAGNFKPHKMFEDGQPHPLKKPKRVKKSMGHITRPSMLHKHAHH